MHGRIIAAFAIIIFLFAGIAIVQQGLWEASTASETHIEFNDTISVSEGNLSGLASSNKSNVVYAPQSDITVTQNGTTIEQPGNWTWIRPNGTIVIMTNTAFNQTLQANVSGYYTIPSASQNVTTALGTIPTRGFGGAWQLAAGVLLVLTAAGLAAASRNR